MLCALAAHVGGANLAGAQGVQGTIDTIIVSPTAVRVATRHGVENAHSITAAVERIRRHGVVRITAGVYREPTILIRKPITVLGDSGAILDGEGQHEIVVV
ncbi:MAG: hypothetical protein IT353_08460, partial [Gemmatimonadaceae bacterium]|nr:hypothetical protein [Gemmatimonadaceae bacterium]